MLAELYLDLGSLKTRLGISPVKRGLKRFLGKGDGDEGEDDEDEDGYGTALMSGSLKKLKVKGKGRAALAKGSLLESGRILSSR